MTRLLLALPLLAATGAHAGSLADIGLDDPHVAGPSCTLSILGFSIPCADPVEVRHCDGGPYDSTMSALCKDTETPREAPAAPVEPPEVVEVPEEPDDQWGPC